MHPSIVYTISSVKKQRCGFNLSLSLSFCFTSGSLPPPAKDPPIESVWLLDLSLTFHFLSPTFPDYLRLAIVHLGLPQWPYAVTGRQLSPAYLVSLHCFRPPRLAYKIEMWSLPFDVPHRQLKNTRKCCFLFSFPPLQPWFELLVPKRLEVDFSIEETASVNHREQHTKVLETKTDQLPTKGKTRSVTKYDEMCDRVYERFVIHPCYSLRSASLHGHQPLAPIRRHKSLQDGNQAHH